MTYPIGNNAERLVKSETRVRCLGEVFTPSATVQEMLDLLPAEMWAIHPSPTFLEPACGDGNFLVAILARKLARISLDYTNGDLAAGNTLEAAQFHALEALASIYGVDISIDNIVGGTPGHEIGARTRMLSIFIDWHSDLTASRLNECSPVLLAAKWILKHNLRWPTFPDSRIHEKIDMKETRRLWQRDTHLSIAMRL